ncbi:MAG: adenylyl-sulfate reductase subunit alpha [Candidatus Rokubacteria bacterium]|nr:adenylyl-sulfate reductase subunit alpha [Candidatus Rokubacteria bacterium]
MATNGKPEVVEVSTDLLIVGGGMAACGAAVEARRWAPAEMKITLVDKAAMDRSGAVAMGLSAVNTYLGENTPEDYVRYVRTDLMGIIREDLVYDLGRHVDDSVHLFEKWGLPIWKQHGDEGKPLAEGGKPVRSGRWQIMISGESYKVIVAEAAKKALGAENIYERVFVVKLLLDGKEANRVAGAVGFSVRENKIYIFRAKAVLVACGGAVHVFRPRSTGEGLGRTWYPPWNSGSTYAMLLQGGAEMTMMENRFVPARFKDGYGPVGAWFLLFKAKALNALGEDYVLKNKAHLKEYDPYGSAAITPTCLRNHLMMEEMRQGRGPIFMDTPTAMKELAAKMDPKQVKELEAEAWEDFLDMTITQAGLWASMNVAPEEKPSEIIPAEPYLMGSHAGCAGAWVSGPEDFAPPEYRWGYNRMTTVQGLFTAGDGVGASGHKFSSGSHAEGRIAAKAAVRFIGDHADFAPCVAQSADELAAEIYRPLATFEKYRSVTTDPAINPHYVRPKMLMFRLNKIMDEYVAGITTGYTTGEASLTHGLELLTMLKEDSAKLAAKDLHELMRCWENYHRIWAAEAHLRHILFRQETRYPGYYYRSDFPKLDDGNWRVFANSRYDPQRGRWECFTKPVVGLVT